MGFYWFSITNKSILRQTNTLSQRLNNVRSIDEFYQSLITEWEGADKAINLDGRTTFRTGIPSSIANKLPSCFDDCPVERMMIWDSINYLPNDILTKVDMAAMNVSLETRAPYLDDNVFYIASRLSLDMTINPNLRVNNSKWSLRNILYKHIPSQLIDRPKAGFGITIVVSLGTLCLLLVFFSCFFEELPSWTTGGLPEH